MSFYVVLMAALTDLITIKTSQKVNDTYLTSVKGHNSVNIDLYMSI